ncbi:serine/threonine-protein phosphatase [Mesorhizobium sp. M4B.F.Ca.ET.215.01.1.1]|uniref:PP2C family protein-serine/threonine phosphatase n=1 Tax=Mesorhizobium TaxID=68287 RepID=UPI000FCC9752|nr:MULTISPECIES: protein phosphatase 2C domain-containing protein [unclassified Mesorhizobium]RUW21333.1 serine/threonine-protein phosphatase [Mesorhizobium sp. M4B.F.Ca.ET.013.02.1.1]RVD37982.1 serine/threonine-protein phosphatase [Mesorhizobium sp. M4B.F.Ca.ET.019.03.1.1]RWF28425.1 MAG: serine/threonine-protein phosphatase [Mesorhizobium sp.]RWF39282.1 MAG: serine/threonine-protein phosphatase [Mesorhizobium sp.]RWF65046.1 MAG: serine/threonine-protein phosphatase [Mesorhizobium sp.]
MNNVALPFESFGVSHKGCVRDLNEDSYLVEPRTGLWVVADGMGGHDAGEVASASIVDHLATIGIASSAPDLRARFEDRLSRANAEIRGISEARGITIGSTFAALLVMDGRFACLWAGDSRVYLVRNASISQISKDHTEVQELLDRGMISAAEALTWPRRNVITHAVGVSDDVVIDYQQGETMPGDIFVLNTDGLTAHVSDAEIEAAVLSAAPQAACENLLETVLARGGTDNVTIILVKIGDRRNGQAAGPHPATAGSGDR